MSLPLPRLHTPWIHRQRGLTVCRHRVAKLALSPSSSSDSSRDRGQLRRFLSTTRPGNQKEIAM